MERLNQIYKTNGGSKFGAVISLMGFAVGMLALMGLIVGLLSLVERLGGRGGNSYEREHTVFHTLPAAPYGFRDSQKNIVIEDDSPCAEDEALALYQYTCRFYQDGLLTQETDYDPQGSRTCLHTWQYDLAGNVQTEQIEDEAGGIQTYRHIYEYDDLDRMVHEEIYRNEQLMERDYFRYLYASYEYGGRDNAFDRDIGYAGVSYSYLNDQIDGGISYYCANRTEFVTDTEGNPLCMIKLRSLEQDSPDEAWKMQWQRQGDQVLNRVQYYKDDLLRYYSSTSDWYLELENADAEQFKLYECSETSGKHLTLQINYNNKSRFLITNSFYRAQYDGDRLLWQMDYVEGRLAFYSACFYDGEGRLQEVVEYEYDAQGEGEPQAFFYRYTYPEPDREDQYSYAIQGEAFARAFGDEGQLRLAFSADGILTKIEMIDIAGNGSETCEFSPSGENAGRIRQMAAGTDVTEGERAVLRKLEKEAAGFGFHAGEDLEGSAERGAE